MDNKYLVSFLLVVLFFSKAVFSSGSVHGDYSGKQGLYIKIEADVPKNRFSLIYGDVTQRVENYGNDDLEYCLLFNAIDFLIPKKFVVESEYKHMGSSVNVSEYFPQLLFGNSKFEDVYRLDVTRGKWMTFDGKRLKRSDQERKFELLYSVKDGLIAFKELPSDREDYFLIDWRSLENREINGIEKGHGIEKGQKEKGQI